MLANSRLVETRPSCTWTMSQMHISSFSKMQLQKGGTFVLRSIKQQRSYVNLLQKNIQNINNHRTSKFLFLHNILPIFSLFFSPIYLYASDYQFIIAAPCLKIVRVSAILQKSYCVADLNISMDLKKCMMRLFNAANTRVFSKWSLHKFLEHMLKTS